MLNYPGIFYSIDPTPEQTSDKPRTLCIHCSRSVGKQELINYVKTFWGEMTMFMDNQATDKKRDKSAKVFIRDVDIYNKYHELPGLKNNAHVLRTARIITEMGLHDITDDMVRKIVSTISKLEREINTEV